MMFLRRIRQYRVYRRLVLSYLLLLVVTITLLSIILYSMFSARAVQEIDRSSKQMLTQVSYAANVVYGQIQDVTGQMLSDNEIMSFLYAKEDSKTVDYTANLFLNRIQGVYPFIKNISIYNFTTGAYIDSPGLASNPGMAIKDETGDIGFFPRKAQSVTGKSSYRLWTFKIIPERSFTEVPKSAIVVDLDETYIRNTMRNISASSRDSLTFVMDASGKVLSHSSPEYFMEDFSHNNYVKKILADTNSQGSFVQKIDRQKHLVTYVKSANLDWYFISVRPYAELISNIYELRNWTILIVILLIIAGAAISLLLSGNIYNPIKSLLDKVNATDGAGSTAVLRYDEYALLTDAFTEKIETAKTMESTLNRSSRVLKDNYITHLLKGNANKIAVSAEMKREWEGLLNGPFLTVILFKIDGYRAFRERYNLVDRGLIRFAIGNIAHELLGNFYRDDVANMEDDEIALILQSDIEPTEDPLYLILGEIQDTIRSYYQISLSVSVGDPCESVNKLRDSYKSAQENVTSRLFLGRGCLIDQAAVNRRTPEYKPHYPASIEKRLIDAIKLCHPATIRTEITEFRKFLSECTYSGAMQYTNFLILGITKEFEYITEWRGVDSEQLYRTADEFRDIETLDDIEQKIAGLCSRIVDILEQNKKNTAMIKNAKIIEEIQQFVREQYAEHGLSLEAAADKVGFSSGYIGKLFKNMTGTTFNDYVTHIRMEQAKIFLAASNDTVAQVGERVGVYNVPYFTTLFKKTYGITPSQYREQAPRG
ncbi:helix-turn-helix domain-containing protein [Cohnella sp.]|uniref:helix-turn-helix domain-containing protein n=1 Tax=Cohnella sp. TaxID=1883426 RepID=UPI003569EE86